MIDLTLDGEDNSTFITKVELNDDLKTYTVTYADNHTIVKPFDSIHNFNVDIHRMENQYFKHYEKFNNEMRKWFKETLVKSLVELVLAISSIILTTNFVSNSLIKTLIIALTILFSIGYQLYKFRDLVTIGYSLNYLDTLKRFIDIQEKLKVPVTDPNTGKEEDWYMANLSSVDISTNVSLYEKYALVLQDDELKKEEGLRLTKTLKGE